jgi:hypothetical protein
LTKIDIGKPTLEEYKAGLRPRNFRLVPANPEFETRLTESLSNLGEQLTEKEIQEALHTASKSGERLTKEEIKEALHKARRDLNLASKAINITGNRDIEVQLIGRKLNILLYRIHEKPTDL